MPIPEMYIEDAVYWAPLDPDDNGQKVFAAPVAVKVRWKDESEMFIDATGNNQVSRARVRVDRDVEELGVLWKGLLAGITTGSDTDPFLNSRAFEIRRFMKIPNRRAEDFVRVALL